MLSKRKHVELLIKKVAYTKAAKNTVEKMLSKNDRIEMLVKKTLYGSAVKTPSQNVIQKEPYPNARQKIIVRNSVQNTVSKPLSKNPYRIVRQKSTL